MTINADTSHSNSSGEGIAEKLTFLVVFFIAAKVLLGIFALMVLVGICVLPILAIMSIDNPTMLSDALSPLVAYATGGGVNQVMAWVLVIVVVSSLLPAVKRRISGNHETDSLRKKVLDLESKLSEASQEIVSLQEHKSFEHKLKQCSSDSVKELIS